MTRDEIFAQVVEAMVEAFELEPDQITMDSHLIEDLDLDSIDAIDMAVKLQEMSGRRVEEEALKQVRTVRDVVDLMEAHLSDPT